MNIRSRLVFLACALGIAAACSSSDSGSSNTSGKVGTAAEYIPSCEKICAVAKSCGWTSGSRPNCANLCAASMVGLAVTVEGAALAAQCYQASSCDLACKTCNFNWCS